MSRKNLIVREKKNDKGEIFREFSLRDEHSYMIGLNNGIEKGKLEQKKEELFYFQRAYLLIPMYKSKGKFYSIKSCDKLSKWIEKRIKQLQKEIK